METISTTMKSKLVELFSFIEYDDLHFLGPIP